MPRAMLHIGPYTLLTAERRLLRDGEPIGVGPRAFDLLCALAERHGELVSKADLLDAVWPGEDIAEANLHVQASKLRKALGADALSTVAGRGYRLALPVRLNGEAAPPTRPLSVVVLPFTEPAAPPSQAYFADAVTDDVTTQLAHLKGAFVIASSTALALRGPQPDLATVARELGVRYVLQGRIARSGGRLELNARLSDAATLEVLWADDFTVDATDLRALRREVVARLAAALDLELTHVEAERSRRRPNPTAVDLLLQARDPTWRSWKPRDWAEPLALIERALQLDPDHPDALIEGARLRLIATFLGPVPDLDAAMAQIDAQLARALAAEPTNARGQYVACMLRRQQRRLEESLQAGMRALELQPDMALALTNLGETLLLLGRPADALAPLHRALEVSPRDPTRGFTWLRIGRAQMLLGDAAQAIPWLERIDDRTVNPAAVALWLAAARISAGDTERGVALYRAHRAAIVELFGWYRCVGSPAYLRLWRERGAAPLLASGAESDPGWLARWLAGQRGTDV